MTVMLKTIGGWAPRCSDWVTQSIVSREACISEIEIAMRLQKMQGSTAHDCKRRTKEDGKVGIRGLLL